MTKKPTAPEPDGLADFVPDLRQCFHELSTHLDLGDDPIESVFLVHVPEIVEATRDLLLEYASNGTEKGCKLYEFRFNKSMKDFMDALKLFKLEKAVQKEEDGYAP